MFHIVLVEPEIPPNTGNVIRLAANTGCDLHLIEPLGFSMEDRHAPRRAGLPRIRPGAPPCRLASLSDRHAARARAHVCHDHHGSRPAFDLAFQPGDWLVFGCETRGLPADLRNSFPESQRLRLPMLAASAA
jgi:tRNA (cytidine/uridine-2'-O-)-methyltransferase